MNESSRWWELVPGQRTAGSFAEIGSRYDWLLTPGR